MGEGERERARARGGGVQQQCCEDAADSWEEGLSGQELRVTDPAVSCQKHASHSGSRTAPSDRKMDASR